MGNKLIIFVGSFLGERKDTFGWPCGLKYIWAILTLRSCTTDKWPGVQESQLNRCKKNLDRTYFSRRPIHGLNVTSKTAMLRVSIMQKYKQLSIFIYLCIESVVVGGRIREQ